MPVHLLAIKVIKALKISPRRRSSIFIVVQLVTSALLLSAPLSSVAETKYVIDQLLVGLHAEKNLESAIIKVLPTGTMLEILEREGELARVRDNDNSEGWIDIAYLMNNPPARLMVERLERANTALQQQLEVADDSISNAPDSNRLSAATDKLTKENTELKRKLSTELINAAKLTEKLNGYEAQLSDRPLSAAETQVTELEKTVVQLKSDLEQSLQDNEALAAENGESLGEMLPTVDIHSFSWQLLAGVLAVIVLAYGGGIYTMDYLNRRRLGGFRV